MVYSISHWNWKHCVEFHSRQISSKEIANFSSFEFGFVEVAWFLLWHFETQSKKFRFSTNFMLFFEVVGDFVIEIYSIRTTKWVCFCLFVCKINSLFERKWPIKKQKKQTDSDAIETLYSIINTEINIQFNIPYIETFKSLDREGGLS